MRWIGSDDELKQCSQCGMYKEFDNFYKANAQATGYRPSCTSCDAYSRNLVNRRAYEARYWTGAKKQEKKLRIKRIREANLVAYSEVLRKYRLTDGFKELHRAHGAARRARFKNAFVEYVNYGTVYRESTGCCTYCLIPICFEDVEFDHFIPIAAGGKHEKGNIRVSCRTCNRVKAAKIVVGGVCH